MAKKITKHGSGTSKGAKSAKEPPRHDTTAVRGLIALSLAIGIFLSLLSFAYGQGPDNWLGPVGRTIGRAAHGTFGLGSYVICLYLGWMGWRALLHKPIEHPIIKTFYVIALFVSLGLLLSLIEDYLPSLRNALSNFFYPSLVERKMRYHFGGALIYYLYRDLPNFNLLHAFHPTGVLLLSSSMLLASLLFLTQINLAELLVRFFTGLRSWWQREIVPDEEEDLLPLLEEEEETVHSRLVGLRIPTSSHLQTQRADMTSGNSQELLAIQPDTNPTVRPSLSKKVQEERSLLPKRRERERPAREELQAQETPSAAPTPVSAAAPPKPKRQASGDSKAGGSDFRSYHLPQISLLTNAKKVDNSVLKQDLRRQAEVLEETLLSFGIEAKVGQINCGPTITSFEVHPAIGVKVQKIKTLENDIALNMEAKSIRIIAPIPGKAAVGIEVPNPQPQEVSFKDMLGAYQQGSRKFQIPVLLGKAVNGDYVMNDLTKMPHCIIAGATGSGKSVCINTIIMTIIMSAKPDEIKLIMVDPKKVELTPYSRLPHMLAPVITEPQGACAALNWLVKEMESRYELLKQFGVRNIEAFNNRTVNKEFEAALEKEVPARLPYIVVIIDELADLMMVSSSDIETPIARIAQMARAVGIHLILATQRPSREVITGLIKANFPTRISFKVASRVNSQIVLDEIGAESLLGNGDMLFLPPGTSTLIRAQGAFIRDEDIAAVVTRICDQAPPNYVIASFDALGEQDNEPIDGSELRSDTLFDQAIEIVRSTGNASTTFLQRKLKIGYARAASLIDQLEAKGVIAPIDSTTKMRKVIQSSTPPKIDNIPELTSQDEI